MSRTASRGSSARGTVRLWDELAERERTVAAWRDRTARLEAELADQQRMTGAWCEQCRQAEERLAKVVEAGNHLVREVSSLPWRPGEGHLTDAVEMWRSIAQPKEESRG